MTRSDDNNSYVLLLVDPDGNPIPASVDHVTGYLNIVVTNNATTATPQSIAIDENNEEVGLVLDDSSAIVPLLTDSNGKVRINFTEL